MVEPELLPLWGMSSPSQYEARLIPTSGVRLSSCSSRSPRRAYSVLVEEPLERPPTRLEVLLGVPMVPFVLMWDLLKTVARGIAAVRAAVAAAVFEIVSVIGRLLRNTFGPVVRAVADKCRWCGRQVLRALHTVVRGLQMLRLWIRDVLRLVWHVMDSALRSLGHALLVPLRWIASLGGVLWSWVVRGRQWLGRLIAAPLQWAEAVIRRITVAVAKAGRVIRAGIAWVGRVTYLVIGTPLQWAGTVLRWIGAGIARVFRTLGTWIVRVSRVATALVHLPLRWATKVMRILGGWVAVRIRFAWSVSGRAVRAVATAGVKLAGGVGRAIRAIWSPVDVILKSIGGGIVRSLRRTYVAGRGVTRLIVAPIRRLRRGARIAGRTLNRRRLCTQQAIRQMGAAARATIPRPRVRRR